MAFSKHRHFLFLIFFLQLSCKDVAARVQPDCFADAELKIVICSLPADKSVTSSITALRGTESVSLQLGAPGTISTKRSYPAQDPSGKAYQVYFSRMPVINIAADSLLNNTTKVSSSLTYADRWQRVTSNVGIEFRGASALLYPKKSYDLEFWTNTDGESRDVALAGMREDDDWVLDALYNEPLRINALVAQRLWNTIYDLPYRADDERARGGAAMELVEVFFNGAYQGIYTLGEQVDRKLLRLKKTNEDGVRGHLVKVWAIPTDPEFANIGPYDASRETWGGFELKYPNPKDTIHWNPLARLHERFVSDAAPKESLILEDHFDLDNSIDYDIFINVIGGIDNEGKNIYLARRDVTSPYLYIPWDLDASFGNHWDGTRVQWGDQYFTPLYHDVIQANTDESYFETRCERYANLRNSGTLSAENLGKQFAELYDALSRDLLYEREKLVWPDVLAANQDELDYTVAWIQRRLEFLDTQYCPAGFSPITSTTEPGHFELQLSPNPTSGVLNFKLPPGNSDGRSVQVWNVAGQRVPLRQAPVSSTSTSLSLDVSGLASGMYVLHVDGLVAKFIKR